MTAPEQAADYTGATVINAWTLLLASQNHHIAQ
jgi:hypothetical protein